MKTAIVIVMSILIIYLLIDNVIISRKVTALQEADIYLLSVDNALITHISDLQDTDIYILQKMNKLNPVKPKEEGSNYKSISARNSVGRVAAF